jgi:hypothetical protein
VIGLQMIGLVRRRASRSKVRAGARVLVHLPDDGSSGPLECDSGGGSQLARATFNEQFEDKQLDHI